MNPKQTAVQAAKEDKRETGPAGLPNTKPAPGVRPRLSPEAKAARDAEVAADQARNLDYRASQVCNLLVEMGSASLAKRILAYDTVSVGVAEAAVAAIEKRMVVVRTALEQRKASGAAPKVAADGKRERFTLGLQAAAGTPAKLG